MAGDARRGNPALKGWLDSALARFNDRGGGSAEGFVDWLDGPDGPDTPTLGGYASGERTYIGYAMDPDTLSAELHLDCTPAELDAALARVQDQAWPATATVDSLLRTWSDEMNDAVCFGSDLLGDSLDEAIGRSGITVGGPAASP